MKPKIANQKLEANIDMVIERKEKEMEMSNTYANVKKTSLLMVILTLLIMVVTVILPMNSVKAVDLVQPSDMNYVRWRTDKLGIPTVKVFFEFYSSIQGIEKKMYTYDGKEVSEDSLVGTGMNFKRNNEKVHIAVKGDINGDGKVSATDLSIYKLVHADLRKVDYIYERAVDMNNDFQRTITDLSQLKMLLVGMPLPEENPDPNDKTPKLDGEIVIKPSTDKPTKDLTITVEWPEGTNLDGYTKQISKDGGKTFEPYTGPFTLDENALIIVAYRDKDGNTFPGGEKVLLIENIDKIAPTNVTFTADATTSTITVNATAEDKLKDYKGDLIENEYTGIDKFLYSLDGVNWQESNVFDKLTPNTEYTVYVKAVDFAGNESEPVSQKISTKALLDPTVEGSRILVAYSPEGITRENVTVTFSFQDPKMAEFYNIQYQVTHADGKTEDWTIRNTYLATENCTIRARIVDNNDNASEKSVVATVANIDKLQPKEFKPVIANNSSNKTTITSSTEDAPDDGKNISSGIAGYKIQFLHKNGKYTSPNNDYTMENANYVANENLIENKDYIAVVVYAKDKAGNERMSEWAYFRDWDPDDPNNPNNPDNPDDPDKNKGLGVGEYNEGPGHKTVQGADKSYSNPVIPPGFKAVNTPGVEWGPYMPDGWDKGLVIEDRKGNQFIWVPVPCEEGTKGEEAIDAMILNNREMYTVNQGAIVEILYDEVPEAISKGEADKTGRYKYKGELVKQVEEYQGFYISRYEAGRKDGVLASQEGLETVNMVKYAQAKEFAEKMYQNPYVVSGLPTGVHWDLLSAWIAEEYGIAFVKNECAPYGNVSLNSFTFTGRYAEGPKFGSGEQRGLYKEGTNVTKQRAQEMLLTTGIVDKFKIKNGYDFYGNVWEYTTERVKVNGQTGVNARAAGYYWENQGDPSKADSIGIQYRGFAGDELVSNEGGFRIILYLAEGDAKAEGDYNRTINGGTASYNNPVIPAGYSPIDAGGAKWGDGSTPAVDWDKGLVITDNNGNEFVWVPVGNGVNYETWLDVYITHEEVGESEIPAAWKEKGKNEESSINEFGGFYIARYETSTNEKQETQTKSGQSVKTNVSYNEAVELTANFKTGKTSTPGIITGKQWDTVLKWISKEKGEDAVAKDSSSWGSYGGSVGNTGRSVAKNIYDLAGNAWELTSETYNDKIIYRGGSAHDTGKEAPAGYRDAYSRDDKDAATTYRMVLYVDNDGYVPNDVEVPKDTPGYATGGNIIKYTITPDGWTNQPVTVTLSTEEQQCKIQYAIVPSSTEQVGEWKEENQFTVNENSKILGRLVDNAGNITYSEEVCVVDKIDTTLPADFTINVTVEGTKVRIKDYTAIDNESGIAGYEFYADSEIPIRDSVAVVQEVLSNDLSIGTHQIYVKAVDNAGNKKPSAKVEVTIGEAVDPGTPGNPGESGNSVVGLRLKDQIPREVLMDAYIAMPVTIRNSNPATPLGLGYGWVGDINNPSTWQYETLQFKDWFSDNGHGLIFTERNITTSGWYGAGGSYTTVNGYIGGRIEYGENYGHNNTYIIGGSGTAEDPYIANTWWLLKQKQSSSSINDTEMNKN